MRVLRLASLPIILLACRATPPQTTGPSRDHSQEAELSLMRRERQSRDVGSGFAFPDKPSLAVWRRNDSDSPRLLVVWLAPLIGIPGVSRARIAVFDAGMTLLSDEAFLTGWRISVESVEAAVSPAEQDLLLRVGRSRDQTLTIRMRESRRSHRFAGTRI